MRLIHGDCFDALRNLPDCAVDAVVTDPPAGISFMGKSWDGNKGGRDLWVAWLAERLAECLRVLKPGGHAVVWALPRTSGWTHRALEDAGFEVRDCITHLFGSGFPKSLDVGKAIDKAAGCEREIVGPPPYTRGRATQSYTDTRRVSYDYQPSAVTAPATEQAQQWDGWGTALKPAAEFWYLARKPLGTTVAANVCRWGTGALNIDASRVAGAVPKVTRGAPGANFSDDNYEWQPYGESSPHVAGRWPANVALTHPDCDHGCGAGCPIAELDQQSGTAPPSARTARRDYDAGMYGPQRRDGDAMGYGDSGGASRFFPTFRHSERTHWCMLSGWRCSSANTADCGSVPTAAPSDGSVQGTATTRPGDSIVRLVASAGHLCELCATTIARSIALTQQGHSRTPLLGLPFTGDFNERILSQNLALCVEALASSDTTSITANLATSLGCVVSVISESITRASAPSTSGSGQFVPYKYQAKPSTREKNAGVDDRNTHPTVKPVELMRWLIRLITPPGGTVLDPFAGSGTTLVAATLEGFDTIGVEERAEYLPIIEGRVRWAEEQCEQMPLLLEAD